MYYSHLILDNPIMINYKWSNQDLEHLCTLSSHQVSNSSEGGKAILTYEPIFFTTTSLCLI
jgi:hypothetical protein